MPTHATQVWVDNRLKVGDYTGTEIAHDIVTGFAPKRIEIIDDDSGELVTKTKKQLASKCFLSKKFGQDQVAKFYTLTGDGITFSEDRVTIGTSPYINGSGNSYSYTIWG